MSAPASEPRKPTLTEALIPVACLIVFVTASVLNVGDVGEVAIVGPFVRFLASLPLIGSVFTMSVPVQIPLAAAATVAACMAWRLGHRWKSIEEAFIHGVSLSMGAILILLVVGALIGTWIASGVVPLMIYYGLHLLAPGMFLVAACLLCCVVSLAIGSSWTTAGTVGIALIGVGKGLNIPTEIVAGAVISGAYFGDKMSPLSDTTNLAPGVAGSELFEHVRHMCWTTGPSLLIALGLFWFIDLRYKGVAPEPEEIQAIVTGLKASFNLSPWLLLAPAAIFLMVILKVPALPGVAVGAALGGVLALLTQDSATLGGVLNVAYAGYASETGVAAIDDLLSRGGMESMYSTVGIILAAMCFGGVMERTGMLAAIADGILSLVRTRGGLVSATLGTCFGMNLVASDQYLSIVVPGRMYKSAFEKANLHPKNLSRCLEDAGTLTSPLVPWNSCGAYMYATLGVAPFAYLPYCFLNLVNPLISALYGWMGWTMTPLRKPSPAPAASPAPTP